MKPKQTISAFDVFLAQRGLVLDAVAIGGAALGLLGVIRRRRETATSCIRRCRR